MSLNCPKCGAPLEPRAVAEGVSAEACFHCFGVFYDLAELRVPVELAQLAPAKLSCPKDGRPMSSGKAYGGAIALEQCSHCGGVWFDRGEIQKLRELSGTEDVVGLGGAERPAASGPEPRGPLFIPPIPVFGGSTARPAPRPPAPAAPAAGPLPVPTPEFPTRSPEPLDSAHEPNPDQRRAPVVRYQDRDYKHFQTSFPTVTYVLGEFNWKVAVGDTGKARDFVSPPFVLSQDVSAQDSTWSHGEYLEPREVWGAFGLPGNPPLRHGVNLAQVNPHAAARRATGLWFGLYAAAAVLLYAALAALAQNKVVFSAQYAYSPPAPAPAVVETLGRPNEAAFVTPEFELTGKGNARVRTSTNLDNQWLSLGLALINADTDIALDFDRELSHYHGVEDGEAWSEGSRDDRVFLPKVPAGRYYLRVEPESPGSVSYGVEVSRDVPQLRWLFCALGLLLAPVLWSWARHWNFEKSRWAESDHPLVEEGD